MSADRLRSAGKVSGGKESAGKESAVKESAGKFESAAARELELAVLELDLA